MSSPLLVGTAEIDITPPIGTMMAGSLQPRPSLGVDDPLLLKVIVLEVNGVRIAYAIFDLVALSNLTGEAMTAAASARTGIPTDNIIWSCSHTHSGPVSIDRLYPGTVEDPVPRAWLAALPERFATCVSMADAHKAPAQLLRAFGYQHGLGHNRRVKYKDGRQINTWLHNGKEDAQPVGSAAPIDPEVGILGFQGLDGNMLAVIFHFTLHANAHFGTHFSGDYPAVVAARLREHFGSQVCALFMTGACGDINPVRKHHEIGDALADTIIAGLQRNPEPVADVTLGTCRRSISVPARDVFADQEVRLQATQWDEESRTFFRESQRDLQENPPGTTIETIVQAWHIGDIAFATFPGELFVEHGLRLKAESPFPWSYPIELSHGAHGYLITRTAWEAGGYESLVASMGQVAPEGVEQMVETNLALLRELRNS